MKLPPPPPNPPYQPLGWSYRYIGLRSNEKTIRRPLQGSPGVGYGLVVSSVGGQVVSGKHLVGNPIPATTRLPTVSETPILSPNGQ